MSVTAGNAHRFFGAALEALQDGLILLDPTGRAIWANRAVTRLTGLAPARLLGRPVAAWPASILVRGLLDAEAPDRPETAPAVPLRGADGRVRLVSLTVTALRTPGPEAGDQGTLIAISPATGAGVEVDALGGMLLHALGRVLGASEQPHVGAIAGLSDAFEDLLDSAALDGGRIGLVRERVDVAAILRQVVAVVSAAADADRVLLRLALPDRLPSLSADAALLEFAVRRVLEHSRRFAGDGGCVSFSALEDGRHLLLRCRDDGPDGEEDLAARAEDLLFSGAGGQMEEGPTAPACSLARRIVLAHGGDLFIDSRGKGDTSVIVRLPLPPRVSTASRTGALAEA